MAQKDAQLITQYLPTQSLGYLQSSKVYLEQGDVPNAMAALDTALEHVSKKDAHYQEIVRQRNSTLEVASLSNMQNLGQLSAEILSLIFGSLPVRYLIQCLQVCKGWYKYLEECQEVWSDINLDVDASLGKRSVKNYVAWLKKRNVRKLKISVECGRAKAPTSHTCCGIYLESFNEWESVAYKNSVGRLGLNRQINHIYIMLCYLELRFMHDFLPDFSQFLEHNYETLTCIELLSPESKYSRPVIYQILDECQNLMTLQLPNSSYHGEATIRISRKLKIKYLTWSLSNTFSCKDLMIVLKHCPDLQILELCDNYTLSAEISRTLTQVFSQIGDICPSLRQVLFTGCVNHNGAPMST